IHRLLLARSSICRFLSTARAARIIWAPHTHTIHTQPSSTPLCDICRVGVPVSLRSTAHGTPLGPFGQRTHAGARPSGYGTRARGPRRPGRVRFRFAEVSPKFGSAPGTTW